MTAPHTLWHLPEAPPVEPVDGPAIGANATSEEPAAGPPAPPPAPLSTAGRPRRRPARLAGALALVLAGGAVGGAVGAQVAGRDTATGSAVPTTQTVVANTGNGLDVAAVLAAVENAVVDIQARGPRSTGQGSGVIFSADGYVLTNAHVVSGATSVTVTTPTDKQARAATIVGADDSRDIALVKINDPSGLVVAQLGDSAAVKVGADVVAIGNALGLRGDPSVTRGIVSALDRTIGNLSGMLQTDAAINPGNSGGPLVNASGQVIGINTAIAVEAGAQNIGFAIPIDTAKQIADRLKSGQAAAPAGYLGVSTSDAATSATGAVVQSVSPDSPAAAAGLAAGDVIVAVGGTKVSGAADLSRLISDRQPGDSVTLTVVRGGTEQQLTAKLTTRPSTN
jgi:putative serine protease PepD